MRHGLSLIFHSFSERPSSRIPRCLRRGYRVRRRASHLLLHGHRQRVEQHLLAGPAGSDAGILGQSGAQRVSRVRRPPAAHAHSPRHGGYHAVSTELLRDDQAVDWRVRVLDYAVRDLS